MSFRAALALSDVGVVSVAEQRQRRLMQYHLSKN